LLESFIALSLAHSTIPHGLSPQGAILMMLLPPGLLQIPSIEEEEGDAAWAASAAISASAGMARLLREVNRLVSARQ